MLAVTNSTTEPRRRCGATAVAVPARDATAGQGQADGAVDLCACSAYTSWLGAVPLLPPARWAEDHLHVGHVCCCCT